MDGTTPRTSRNQCCGTITAGEEVGVCELHIDWIYRTSVCDLNLEILDGTRNEL